MKIASIQAPLVWEDVQQNVSYFRRKIQELSADIDLVILPEMFTTGFTMTPEQAYSEMSSELLKVFQELSDTKDIAITGSLIIKQNGVFYNRLVFISPCQDLVFYDKRHLFSLAGEQKVYKSGNQRIIVEFKGWRICPLVCYDLRFPGLARNQGEAYDLLLYVASWPNQRIYAWDSLLKARAIENMSYVIGVNRCGEDQNKNIYSGHSQVLDCFGNYIVEPAIGEQILYASLSLEQQNTHRKRFGFLQDADDYVLDNK